MGPGGEWRNQEVGGVGLGGWKGGARRWERWDQEVGRAVTHCTVIPVLSCSSASPESTGPCAYVPAGRR